MLWSGDMTRKERTAFLLENGICTTCGKMKAAEGRNSCLNCLDSFKVIYEERKAKRKMWYQNHKEEIKTQHKKHREELKRLGLCVMCGKKAVEGLTICQMCRNKKRRYYDERCRQSC